MGGSGELRLTVGFRTAGFRGAKIYVVTRSANVGPRMLDLADSPN